MSIPKKLWPYDIAENQETEMLHIGAFGRVVPNTPTFHPDDEREARKYCEVLNAAYMAGVERKAGTRAPDDDPGFNPMR